jgi:hypothetical protein
MSGPRLSFATLSQVLGAVAQSGSAPRSHRGGQGFKSPQLHRVLAGQWHRSISWLSTWEPLREPSRRFRVWLGLCAVATAKTASTSITGRTATTALITRPVPGDGEGWSRSVSTRTASESARRSAARPRLRQDGLKVTHLELDAGLRTTQGYTVRFTLTEALYHHLGRTSGGKAVRTMVDSDLRERRGRMSRTVGPVFDLVTAKLLSPLVRSGTIRWSQRLRRSDDGGACLIASVVREQARVLL